MIFMLALNILATECQTSYKFDKTQAYHWWPYKTNAERKLCIEKYTISGGNLHNNVQETFHGLRISLKIPYAVTLDVSFFCL